MNEYVLTFPVAMDLVDRHEEILLIEKKRPDWQKGKFNLTGGHVEEGETAIETAVRELKEETGYEPLYETEHEYNAPHCKLLGKLTGDWGVVYCIRINVYKHPLPAPRPEEDEKVFWIRWEEAKAAKQLIPNLKLIVPLMMTGVEGWTLVDNLGDDLKIIL